MKIGILTFHNADNYGAVLQCYALQEVLKRKFPNDDVSVVDYRNKKIEKSKKVIQLRKKIISNVTQFIYVPSLIKKSRMFDEFRQRVLDLDSDSLSEYDAIFYGSDQIWNFELTGSDLVYLGKGFSGIKIAYAASDGGGLVDSKAEVEDLLLKFNEISCREKSLTQKIIALTSRHDIKTVCDPVFLISKIDWLKIAVLPKEHNYILAYKVGENPDFDREVEKVSRYLGKPVIQIVYQKSIRKLFYQKPSIVKNVVVEKFLGYFANADLVLTTSFHGTAFSLIFEKTFYVLKIKKRSERITDLLAKVGCRSRYVDSVPSKVESMDSVQTSLNKFIDTSKAVLDEYIKFAVKKTGLNTGSDF